MENLGVFRQTNVSRAPFSEQGSAVRESCGWKVMLDRVCGSRANYNPSGSPSGSPEAEKGIQPLEEGTGKGQEVFVGLRH